MKQWKRNCRLTVQLQKGQEQALDLSEYKIRFRIGQATVDNPKFADIYIYNLSPNTMNRLSGEKGFGEVGQTVILEAGYGNELAIIFKGQVFQYRRGRDNPTDTWLCILAQSGNQAINYGVVNKTHPAGMTQQQIRDELKEEYKKCGVDAGYMCDVSDQALPRGKSFIGMLRDYTKQFMQTNDTDLVIEDDKVVMIPRGGSTDEPAFAMTPKTGMIGMPQLTTEGLRVTCLLNPRLKWGGKIQVDISHIQTQAYDVSYSGQYVDQPYKNLETAQGQDGFYNVVSVTHSGDTRGDEWYSELVCVGVGSSATPLTGAAIKAVQ